MSYVSQMTSLGVISPGRAQERYGINNQSMAEIQQKAGKTTSELAAREQLTLPESSIILKLNDALVYQRTQFERYRDLAEQKFTTLSKDLLDVSMQLKATQETLARYKDRFDVQSQREALHSYQKGDKPAVDRPIDRNGVAPSAVKIENIFNCAGKRF